MPEQEEEQPSPPQAPAATAGDEQAKRGVEAAAKNEAPPRSLKSDVNRGAGASGETSSTPPLPPATLVISGSSPSAGSTTVTAGLAAALRYGA